MITVQLQSDDLTGKLTELLRRSRRPRSVLQAAARGVRSRLQRHFRERDKEPNRLGGRRTHFWLDVYKSTQLGQVTESFAIVSIGDHRFAQKLRGGTIRAIQAKALTIPVDPEAHGRRAAVFERETGLKLIFIGQGGKGILATRAAGSDALQVRYLLVPSVHQDPDPEALPPQGEMESAALEKAAAQVATEIQQAGLK